MDKQRIAAYAGFPAPFGLSRFALARGNAFEAQVKAAGGPGPLRVEGRSEAQWVLLDYGDFVVHVFLDEVRRYYDLERLWSDVPRIPFSDDVRTAAGGA